MRTGILLLLMVGLVSVAQSADEITVTTRLNCDNGYLSVRREPNTLSVDQATVGAVSGVQLVGTNWEAVTVGDVITPRLAYFRNIMPTTSTNDYVRIAVVDALTNYLTFAELQPGEAAVWPMWTNVTLYARAASTNEVKLDKLILEE